MTKSRAFADDKLNVTKMTISLYNRIENTEGKRRKCCLPAFSPFPTVFSKVIFFRVLKKMGLCGKELTYDHILFLLSLWKTVPGLNDHDHKGF